MLNDQLVRYTRKAHAWAVQRGWHNERYLNMILTRETGVGYEAFPLGIPRAAWMMHDHDPLGLIEQMQVGQVANLAIASRFVGMSASLEGWAVEENDPDTVFRMVEDRSVKHRPDRRSMRDTMSVLVDGDSVACLEFEDEPGVHVQTLEEMGHAYMSQRTYKALLDLAQRLAAVVDLAKEDAREGG